jgi:proline dehydrogenase
VRGFGPMARAAARRYIAGPLVSDALEVSGRLAARGWSITLGYWDGPPDTPADVQRTYREAVEQAPAGTRLAVKLPGIGFDPERFDAVLVAARERGVAIHCDSIGPEGVDPTFALLRGRHEGEAGGEPLGCTLPGRWHRSDADVDRAVELGLRARVVKGQFPGSEEDERDPVAGALRVFERLAGRAPQVAIASHDPSVVRPAVEVLRAAGTPCELELLYGLPIRAPLAIAQAADLPVRVYVPYGTAYLPYALRQALRPRIAFRLAQDLVRPTSWAVRVGEPRGGAPAPPSPTAGA